MITLCLYLYDHILLRYIQAAPASGVLLPWGRSNVTKDDG